MKSVLLEEQPSDKAESIGKVEISRKRASSECECGCHDMSDAARLHTFCFTRRVAVNPKRGNVRKWNARDRAETTKGYTGFPAQAAAIVTSSLAHRPPNPSTHKNLIRIALLLA